MPDAARQLSAELEITPGAARDLHWLERRLGSRYRGWRETHDDLFGPLEIELVTRDRRRIWCYGATLQEVAAAARARVTAGSSR